MGTETAHIHLISDDQVSSLLSMPETIGMMRILFLELAGGRAKITDRTVVVMENGEDSVLYMPGYLPGIRGLGIKVISVFPSNIPRNIPTASAKVLLLDPETGMPEALLDGAKITAMRTAAVSALAADILAAPGADKLGIFGAGKQGKSHIEAIREVRKLKSVHILDVDRSRCESLIAEIPESWKQGTDFSIADTSDEIIGECDMIMTVTTSLTPVFDGANLRPGTHVGAVGSFRPEVREIDEAAIRRMRLFVDSRKDALEEAGDLIIPLRQGIIQESDILGELSDLVSGTVTGRTSADDITFFKSVGMALEDIIVARSIADRLVK